MQPRDIERPVRPDATRAAVAPRITPAAPAEDDPGLEADARRLQRSLTELIRIVQFRDRDRICCHDVSVSQCYALETVVQQGPLTLNELAAGLYLDKSTASRIADGLVAKGYLGRRRHPDDGRAVLLEVTPEGRALYVRIESDLVEESRRVLVELDPDLRAAVVPLLGRLVRAAADRIERRAGSCNLRC